MTVTKLIEERQPHKAILALLEDQPPVEEMDIFCTRACIEACLDDINEEQKDDIATALRDLEREGLIISKFDRFAGEKYAHACHKERIDAEEAEYDALKERVYAGAKKHGLWPKWCERDGWRLVDGGGEAVAFGPMDNLETYLKGLDQDAQKPAA
jgi:hypothetical protein